MLVLHGDVFDAVVMHARWLALLGDGAYTVALWLNRHFNTLRRRLGYPYWSMSAYLKRHVKNAMQYIASFADAVANETRRRGVEVSSAATSTTPKSARSATSFTATVGIGWRAAPPWWSISMGGSSSSIGSTAGRSIC